MPTAFYQSKNDCQNTEGIPCGGGGGIVTPRSSLAMLDMTSRNCLAAIQRDFSRHHFSKQTKTTHEGWSCLLVEAGGIEPPSENVSSGTSPGADDYLHSLPKARNVTLSGSVASLCVVGSKLSTLTGTTRSCPSPARGPSGVDSCGT